MKKLHARELREEKEEVSPLIFSDVSEEMHAVITACVGRKGED